MTTVDLVQVFWAVIQIQTDMFCIEVLDAV